MELGRAFLTVRGRHASPLRGISPGAVVRFFIESNNVHDANAVRVENDAGVFVGHVAWEQARHPDPEYCADLEGLLGYCNEKVRWGHWGNVCLYCQKSFSSAEAVLKHMQDKRHCKILYEMGVDQEDFDVFYDFSEANREFMGGATDNTAAANKAMEAVDDDEEGWEDVGRQRVHRRSVRP